MKIPLTLMMVLAIITSSYAGGYNPFKLPGKDSEKKEAGKFWQHTGEFHVTPSADYFIYKKGSDYQLSDPYEFTAPFIGFDIGGQYMYRPVEVFAVSAGLGFRMQGSYYRHTTTFLGSKFVDATIAAHTGVLTVPIELHLFKRMNKCTFEFATGPQFNFQLFRKSTYTAFNSDGKKIDSGKDTQKLEADDIRRSAALGWNILLGAEINLFEHGDLFVGPQINFLNIAYFNKDLQKNSAKYGDDVLCSLGLKLGFRFH